MKNKFSKAAALPGYDVYSLLQRTIKEMSIPEGSPNKPLPYLGFAVRQATEAVKVIDTGDDLFLKALKTQTLNHLKHVSFRFNVEHETYPHGLVLEDAFAAAPTGKALQKAFDFLDIVYDAKSSPKITPVINRSEEDIRASEAAMIKSILEEPLSYYQAARKRLEKDGAATPFPEFKDTVDFLIFKIENSPDIQSQLAKNARMRAFAAVTHEALVRASCADEKSPSYGYQKTLDAIERGLEFFDVMNRGLTPEKCPPLYHGDRYEYYLHYLQQQTPAHILFPTIYNLSATNLLSVRGVPLGFAGVNAEITRVDSYNQTPYEFYLHDINHSRRMEQFAREESARRGVDDMDFYAQTNRFVHETLLPRIRIKETDSAAEKTQKRIKKMILFEILHEDALPADPDIIRDSILRPPGQQTPFEGIKDGKVSYIMAPGASTLAYVFRKLAHTFYDDPDNRIDAIVDTGARNRTNIAEAAKELFSDLGLGDPPVDIIDAYTSNDSDFPDDFRRELEDDIRKRGLKELETKMPDKKTSPKPSGPR